jgi:hypothetical protein
VTLKVTQNGKTIVPDPTLPNNAAIKRMKELGVGWNLGNQLDALHDGDTSSGGKYGWPDETCWHDFMTLGREPIETVIKAWTTTDATYTLIRLRPRSGVLKRRPSRVA